MAKNSATPNPHVAPPLATIREWTKFTHTTTLSTTHFTNHPLWLKQSKPNLFLSKIWPREKDELPSSLCSAFHSLLFVSSSHTAFYTQSFHSSSSNFKVGFLNLTWFRCYVVGWSEGYVVILMLFEAFMTHFMWLEMNILCLSWLIR